MQQPEFAAAPAAAASNSADDSLVEKLVSAVRHLHLREARGDLAELRRLDAETPSTPAFFRILARAAPRTGRPEDIQRIANFLSILALKPEKLARGSLGTAMAAARISEGRVQRLLAARRPASTHQLRLIARRLAQDEMLPYREIGQLLLEDDEDGEFAEDVRLRIARDYWRVLDHRASDGFSSAES